MCFNKKVIAGLGVAAAALLLLKPSLFGAALPLLLLLACPLSMVLMMRGMSGMSGNRSQCKTGDQSTAKETDETRRGAAVSASTEDHSAEIVRLRAELDQLQAQQAAQTGRPQASGPRDGGLDTRP